MQGYTIYQTSVSVDLSVSVYVRFRTNPAIYTLGENAFIINLNQQLPTKTTWKSLVNRTFTT